VRHRAHSDIHHVDEESTHLSMDMPPRLASEHTEEDSVDNGYYTMAAKSVEDTYVAS
jgi:hypothetical protein